MEKRRIGRVSRRRLTTLVASVIGVLGTSLMGASVATTVNYYAETDPEAFFGARVPIAALL